MTRMGAIGFSGDDVGNLHLSDWKEPITEKDPSQEEKAEEKIDGKPVEEPVFPSLSRAGR